MRITPLAKLHELRKGGSSAVSEKYNFTSIVTNGKNSHHCYKNQSRYRVIQAHECYVLLKKTMGN